MEDEVKVYVDLTSDNNDEPVAYSNTDGKIMYKMEDGVIGRNLIVDAKVVDDAEREAVFTSDDIEEE